MSNSRRPWQTLRGAQTIVHGDTYPAMYKGIVEKVNDPFHHGKVKVRVYAIHGDYKDLHTDDLPWAEPWFPLRGCYAPPELFDRVWVSFEGGNPNRPIWMGYWFATPDGTGKLPFNRKTGLETPRETWFYQSDNHPNVMSLFRTGEGDQLWVEDIPLAGSLHCKINLQDAGGRFLQLHSVLEGKDYRPAGDDVNDPWGPETVHRKTPNADPDTTATAGGFTLGAGHFRISTNSDRDGNYSVFSGTKRDGKYLGLEITNNSLVRTLSGKGGSVTQNLTTGDYSVAQSKTKLMQSAPVLPLPEEW